MAAARTLLQKITRFFCFCQFASATAVQARWAEYLLTTMNFMNSANRVTGQPKGTAATPTLMLWVIIGVATTTLDASDGESDRGDKRPLIGFEH